MLLILLIFHKEMGLKVNSNLQASGGGVANYPHAELCITQCEWT